MTATEDEDEWELREVRRPKGTHRSRSSETPGADRELLREDGTNRNLGPSETRAVDEETLRRKYQGDPIFLTPDSTSSPAPRRELSPEAQAAIEAVVAQLWDYAERQLRERVFPYVRDVTYPAVKRKASEAIARRRATAAQRAAAKAKALEPKPIELEVVDEAEPVATEIEVAEPSIPMSRSDILLAQLQLKRHEDSASRLRWILDHADVVDEDLPPELEQAMTLMLEGRADELGDNQREAITVFLRRPTNPPTSGKTALIEPEGDK